MLENIRIELLFVLCFHWLFLQHLLRIFSLLLSVEFNVCDFWGLPPGVWLYSIPNVFPESKEFSRFWREIRKLFLGVFCHFSLLPNCVACGLQIRPCAPCRIDKIFVYLILVQLDRLSGSGLFAWMSSTPMHEFRSQTLDVKFWYFRTVRIPPTKRCLVDNSKLLFYPWRYLILRHYPLFFISRTREVNFTTLVLKFYFFC